MRALGTAPLLELPPSHPDDAILGLCTNETNDSLPVALALAEWDLRFFYAWMRLGHLGDGMDHRRYPRYRVRAGSCEIAEVIGRGRFPTQRARIMNFSRGGLLLRVRSPRRKFMFVKQKPIFRPADILVCKLRFPPQYAEIHVLADVVYVGRIREELDSLHVGVLFNETTPDRNVEALAAMLERSSVRLVHFDTMHDLEE